MPVKGCRGSEVDDRHLNGSGRLNHQCAGINDNENTYDDYAYDDDVIDDVQ